MKCSAETKTNTEINTAEDIQGEEGRGINSSSRAAADGLITTNRPSTIVLLRDCLTCYVLGSYKYIFHCTSTNYTEEKGTRGWQGLRMGGSWLCPRASPVRNPPLLMINHKEGRGGAGKTGYLMGR